MKHQALTLSPVSYTHLDVYKRQVAPFTSTKFVGYDTLEAKIKVMKYRTVKAKNKEMFQLVFDKTPFYAESGGQAGDSGTIESESGERITILTTIKENDLPIHVAERIPLNLEETFIAKVDEERRIEVANNHTATHLLHHALRSVLGNHIEQKGSSVGSTSFRFDFSHYEKVSHEDLRKVEKLVNHLIRKNIPREEFRHMSIEKANEMGAIALFGEKYGDDVRVIKFGDSTELCGGTHAPATGSLGYFRILNETAIAAGVRRIEATTGRHAEAAVYANDDHLLALSALFNNTPNLLNCVNKLICDNETFKKALEEVEKERAIALKKNLIEKSRVIKGIRLITLRQGTYNQDTVREVAFMLYKELTSAVFISALPSSDGKANLTLMYTDDLVKNGANASADIKIAAKLIQGGGGGQNFLATAGGKNVEGLDEAADKLEEIALSR